MNTNRLIFTRFTGMPAFFAVLLSPPTMNTQLPKRVRDSMKPAPQAIASHQSSTLGIPLTTGSPFGNVPIRPAWASHANSWWNVLPWKSVRTTGSAPSLSPTPLTMVLLEKCVDSTRVRPRRMNMKARVTMKLGSRVRTTR